MSNTAPRAALVRDPTRPVPKRDQGLSPLELSQIVRPHPLPVAFGCGAISTTSSELTVGLASVGSVGGSASRMLLCNAIGLATLLRLLLLELEGPVVPARAEQNEAQQAEAAS